MPAVEEGDGDPAPIVAAQLFQQHRLAHAVAAGEYDDRQIFPMLGTHLLESARRQTDEPRREPIEDSLAPVQLSLHQHLPCSGAEAVSHTNAILSRGR